MTSQPRTYLGPRENRIEIPSPGPFGWIHSVFRTSDSEIIHKCGLDAFFFLRFLRMLLMIFVPLGCLILPVLLPINYLGGKGKSFRNGATKTRWNMVGLDQLAWGNVKPEDSNRYWAHLAMAVVVVVYVCVIFFDELRNYIRIRQHYLTSPQHRRHASAKTVLVTAIPSDFLSEKALNELFNVFPGGVQNIWINRDFRALADKVKMRNNIACKLETAETKLIVKCNELAAKNFSLENYEHAKKADVDHILYPVVIPPSDDNVSSLDSAFQVATATMDESAPNHGEMKMLPVLMSHHVGKFEEKTSSCLGNIDAEGAEQPAWTRYLEQKYRPTMHLPIFGWEWMPKFGKKVDTIEYCRKELSQLNQDIEVDQQNPERFPIMNSAFIQFNHQIAAHMACQTVIHPIPKQMATRVVEVSPHDIIWSNMSVKWWEHYVRTSGVIAIICVMVISWALPVAFTGLLSQLAYIQGAFAWLSWIGTLPESILSAMQGVLPALCMAILMALLPICLRLLSRAQGLQTGKGIGLMVQNYYFAFLFVQLFLVVAIAASFSTIVDNITEVTSWPEILAQNIPKSSNYFFSYMILQAMSVSAGALVQIVELINWFFLAPVMDFTAREKWARMTNLNEIHWDTFFPVYTTLASIGRSPAVTMII